MNIPPERNLRLSRKPISFDLANLDAAARAEAFCDIFQSVIAKNRDMFQGANKIEVESQYLFELGSPLQQSEGLGQSYRTVLYMLDFLADVRQTASRLWQSRNNTANIFWMNANRQYHLTIYFDNPYFILQTARDPRCFKRIKRVCVACFMILGVWMSVGEIAGGLRGESRELWRQWGGRVFLEPGQRIAIAGLLIGAMI